MCFTSDQSVAFRYYMGYSFCLFLSVHVLGNIAFILMMSLKEALWGYKKAQIVKAELKRASKLREETNSGRQQMAKAYLRKRGKFVSLDIFE